jgi:ABC-type glycerol-3-phosphate transport system substrate-binding protein
MKKGLLMLMVLGFCFGLVGCSDTETKTTPDATETEVVETTEGEEVTLEGEVVTAETTDAVVEVETTTDGITVEVKAEAVTQ